MLYISICTLLTWKVSGLVMLSSGISWGRCCILSCWVYVCLLGGPPLCSSCVADYIGILLILHNYRTLSGPYKLQCSRWTGSSCVTNSSIVEYKHFAKPLLVCGHPCWMTSLNFCNTGSSLAVCFTCSSCIALSERDAVWSTSSRLCINLFIIYLHCKLTVCGPSLPVHALYQKCMHRNVGKPDIAPYTSGQQLFQVPIMIRGIFRHSISKSYGHKIICYDFHIPQTLYELVNFSAEYFWSQWYPKRHP